MPHIRNGDGRPGHTRKAQATRAAILAAAKRRFAEHGYEHVGVRDIAGDAGTDIALIARYFGSKEKLFSTVLAELFHIEHLTSGQRSDFGTRIATQLLTEKTQDADGIESVLLAVRAASSPASLPILRRLNYDRFVRPFAEWLGGEDAQLRAHFIASLMSGVVVNRAVAADKPLSKRAMTRYLKRLAATLQSLVDDT